VRKAFQPVKEKPHNSGLANAFYRETVETATPAEVHGTRVRLGGLQGEILRVQAKLTEIERSKREMDDVLKTAGPEYADTVREDIARQQEGLAQLQSDTNRLTTEERDLDNKSMAQEAYVYASELLDFLQSGRYALNPQSVANALAGLPTMHWRQSLFRCSRMPLQQHPRPHYQVLRVILKLWTRCQGESKESLIGFFKTQPPKLPKKLGYTRDFLLENWRDL
jgi:hypothetical protein